MVIEMTCDLNPSCQSTASGLPVTDAVEAWGPKKPNPSLGDLRETTDARGVRSLAMSMGTAQVGLAVGFGRTRTLRRLGVVT